MGNTTAVNGVKTSQEVTDCFGDVRAPNPQYELFGQGNFATTLPLQHYCQSSVSKGEYEQFSFPWESKIEVESTQNTSSSNRFEETEVVVEVSQPEKKSTKTPTKNFEKFMIRVIKYIINEVFGFKKRDQLHEKQENPKTFFFFFSKGNISETVRTLKTFLIFDQFNPTEYDLQILKKFSEFLGHEVSKQKFEELSKKMRKWVLEREERMLELTDEKELEGSPGFRSYVEKLLLNLQKGEIKSLRSHE